MFIGIGNPIPELSNLPGVSRPGAGPSGPSVDQIANQYSFEFDGAGATKFILNLENQGLDRNVREPLSASYWIKPDSQSYIHLNFFRTFICSFTSSVSGRGVRIQKGYSHNGAGVLLELAVTSASDTGGGVGATKLDDGNWHHIVWTVEDAGSDKMECKVYVDGAPENAYGTTTPITALYSNESTSNYYLGPVQTVGNITNTTGAGDNFYYDGYADEVAIFKRVLTPDEIKAIYDATTSGMTADLSTLSTGAPTAWYRMGD